MGEATKIEWCDHTFNPWIGCTKVSPACDHCYAEALNRRWGRDLWGAGKPRQRTTKANWRQPLAWDRKAAADGVRRRVFCASLADVFDAEVDEKWRYDLFGLILQTPNLDWLLLTKRPQVAAKWWRDTKAPIPENIWLGTTVENQAMADLRIPTLLSIPAPVRFLSCEPLLEPVELRDVDDGIDCLRRRTGPRINWVIAGGESGRGARPAHPDWFRSLRDQCAAAGVPYFFKQWGEFEEIGPAGSQTATERLADGRHDRLVMVDPMGQSVDLGADDREWLMERIGKKLAGALLDGRGHREFPR
jgi:protein gp37